VGGRLKIRFVGIKEIFLCVRRICVSEMAIEGEEEEEEEE
jgi:hypothetical protein